MKIERIVIGILLCVGCMGVHARSLSWDWWPTGVVDSVSAGQDTLRWTVGVSAVASSGKYAPFWLQSNMNGDVSSSPFSGNLTAGIYKEAVHPERWWDWDAAMLLNGCVQQPSQNSYPQRGTIISKFKIQNYSPVAYSPLALFSLAYAHVRLYLFDITAGIKPMIYETQDTALTSGSLLFSGNSQPMPRISIGIDRYVPFPGCFGYFEIKGGLTHAWMPDNVFVRGSFLHHKWAALRFGGRLPVNVSYEFHHAAQWGGIHPELGDLGNDFDAFKHVFLAHSGGANASEQTNAQGNHLCSQQWTVTGKGEGWEVSAYWQNISEDNIAFIGDGQNIADGLWGVSMKQTRWPFIEGVTYEFINTTDQSGPWHDRDGLCFAGMDRYYINSTYLNGWNYFYRTMGTPFVTSPLYNEDGTLHTLNNRVRVHHLGVRGDIYGFQYRCKLSYARNYGTRNSIREPLSDNTTLLIEVNRHVEQAWGLDFGVRLAGDFGTQWGNQFGAQVTICKNGIITDW